MKSYVCFFVFLAFSGIRVFSQNVQHIEFPDQWEFSKEGSSHWFPAKVPGVVHLDLLNNHLIEDPYVGNNEEKQRWIENENWVYRNSFTVNDSLLQNNHIQLICNGLDTYAEVKINNATVLNANNMFRKWEVDIQKYLHLGKNIIEITFASPITYNREKVANYPVTLPSGNETEDIPVKVSSFTRKAAYQFGWDWAPRMLSCGIWRPIFLQVWKEAKINDIFTYTLSISKNEAKLQTEVEVEVDQDDWYQLRIDSVTIAKYLSKGKHRILYPFTVKNPKLWWTSELGEPFLYHQNTKLLKGIEKIDERSSHYGIRTIELVNEPDSLGTSFYFKLNDKPVFMKGANYVPQDMFLPRVSEFQYEKLLEAAVEANFNMLRVWGGGIYENDIFYDLCDEKGILVWQDFMFAGSLYPTTEEFQETVEKELIDNIMRLRNHPSIAIWCGNNEIEVAWKNWGWQQQYAYAKTDSIRLWKEYQNIFQEKIPSLLQKLDSQRPYTSTTPLSNWGKKDNFKHSTMHYWGVWHGREPFESFPSNVGRFMVEYGFQSFPNYETLAKNIPDSQMSLHSEMMKNRQKSYIGNGLIEKHIAQYFDTPTDFKQFITLSQQTQALALQMAIESHLNAKPYCMGSLFWQFNDCWPGPSWSVIDYYGNKKKAYFTVQKAFEKK